MPEPIEELQAEFNGYHQETRAAIASLTANVEQLSERFGRQAVPAVARGIGIATAPQPTEEQQHRSALVKFLRTGEIEQRALITSSDPAGGFAVPTGMDEQINDILLSISPIRSIARVVSVTNVGEFEIPIGRRGAASGWADELDTRTVTATPTLASVSPPGGEG
jgi:HK97 family phage major capsid protein